jgi:hypothetical protein
MKAAASRQIRNCFRENHISAFTGVGATPLKQQIWRIILAEQQEEDFKREQTNASFRPKALGLNTFYGPVALCLN